MAAERKLVNKNLIEETQVKNFKKGSLKDINVFASEVIMLRGQINHLQDSIKLYKEDECQGDRDEYPGPGPDEGGEDHAAVKS